MKAFQACLRGTIVVRSAGRPTLVPGFLMTRALYFATSSDVGKLGHEVTEAYMPVFET